jgi:hypothetical protein
MYVLKSVKNQEGKIINCYQCKKPIGDGEEIGLNPIVTALGLINHEHWT